jgi:hypothetical protein
MIYFYRSMPNLKHEVYELVGNASSYEVAALVRRGFGDSPDSQGRFLLSYEHDNEPARFVNKRGAAVEVGSFRWRLLDETAN